MPEFKDAMLQSGKLALKPKAVRVAFLIVVVVIAFRLFVVVVVFGALVAITTTRSPVTWRDFVGTRTRGILEPK